VLLLPAGAGGPAHPNELLASGKSGTIYVINRDHIGHFNRKTDRIIQELPGAVTSSFDTPAYFDNTVYYGGVNDVLKSFTVSDGLLTPKDQATTKLPFPGSSPVMTSDGTQNGIVWVVSPSRELIAYDPADLKQLWSAPLPSYAEFTIPTITDDGHVFVGAASTFVAFGLPQPA
jgi:outer membrane protein assembly factor BamB